ncbi:UDP-N-acetylmuramoyl-tripeptide--D-alanyl-D-alanine ligase [Palleronia aestuarii]|uniref:UDP-N-acetylmuramoyl-tripeptide--D-alanyl-D-alanine ligase n=1 Tax=Palleronia aestuarii TaxID=568105 RepID=A0A2W7NHX8_9RHOB|nr:UDP-N-acetylmuramoyl-tripeptide--D-alanyl-D-alanine ligase [Palleronia aestuarii]PZX16264.1 UDP-N-acetylmuramoyl-tripeptide--D-alanyl-D-alanine ligase [Palleronia aestuarii]
MNRPLWTSEEAAAATGGESRGAWSASGLSIDTRTLAPGDLFVALTAERDGHDFVADAFARGAAAALVARVPNGVDDDAPLLLVDDVLAGLGQMASDARSRFGGKVLAITGSVGKTTTKDMARVALSGQMRVHAAEASYNNHWGVPLTLARLDPDAQVAVIEIGMNHPGEIAPLARLARPDVALVTTIAPAHLEAFASVEEIAREKATIFEGLGTGGTAIVPADSPNLEILAEAARARTSDIRRVGFADAADYRLDTVELRAGSTIVQARAGDLALVFRLGGAGRHFAPNALSVLAAAEALGGDMVLSGHALAEWQPSAGRGTREFVALDPVEDAMIELIDDAFNANPASMGAALDALIASDPGPDGRRVAILGDMLELGADEMALHAAIASHPGLDAVDLVHCAGPRIRAAWEALPELRRGVWTERAEELAGRVAGLVRPGDIVLVKGSKGARTARVVDAIRKLGHRERRTA